MHANPDEALHIFEDVHARFMVPIHFGTFWTTGPEELAELRQAIRMHHADDRVFVLPVGGSLTL